MAGGTSGSNVLGEIAKGMGITLKHFFKKDVTVQYPKQMRAINPRFRGAVAMVRDYETGKERCVGCGLCSAVCPANCLTVVPGVDEHGIRNAKVYLYDMSRCVFCAMCVEVCPELALVMTHEFELSTLDRSQLVLDTKSMLEMADRNFDRTGEAIEEPGFPAVTDAPSTIIKHSQLDTRIQRGNYQSHQPLLGLAPHGYPMAYKDYLEKEKQGKPLAQGNLTPYLQEIQNNVLPEDERKPLPKADMDMIAGTSEARPQLETAADKKLTPPNHPTILQDHGGQGHLEKTDRKSY